MSILHKTQMNRDHHRSSNFRLTYTHIEPLSLNRNLNQDLNFTSYDNNHNEDETTSLHKSRNENNMSLT